MGNVVVDSSVGVKWYIAEEHTTEARQLLSDYQTGALSFLAPDLIYAEVGNIVWKKHRFQGLSAADAESVLSRFQRITFQVTPSADLLDEAYQLAVTHRRSVYDMIFLALSRRAQCRFVTADERLVNAVGSNFPGLVWLPNWS